MVHASQRGRAFRRELKRAGYDGIVVTGASKTPVRIRIDDDEVSILPADDLWGQDALDALETLESRDIEGSSAEYHLFAGGTGIGWSQEEFNRAADRICTPEHALQVRHWARNRQTDEMAPPYFEQEELFLNPLLGERFCLDRQQFKPVMDQFYTLKGWDTERGWPTRERLTELALDDVYDPMVEEAAKAK